MDEIKRPNFKGENFEETIKEIEKYLFTISDQMNWNLLTIENRQTFQGRNITKYTEEIERSVMKNGEGNTFRARFKKIGKMVYVIVTGTEDAESASTKGSTQVKIPIECTTKFFDDSIPAAKDEGISVFLKDGKIAIDYDFGSKKHIGVYFQYVI